VRGSNIAVSKMFIRERTIAVAKYICKRKYHCRYQHTNVFVKGSTIAVTNIHLRRRIIAVTNIHLKGRTIAVAKYIWKRKYHRSYKYTCERKYHRSNKKILVGGSTTEIAKYI